MSLCWCSESAGELHQHLQHSLQHVQEQCGSAGHIQWGSDTSTRQTTRLVS